MSEYAPGGLAPGSTALDYALTQLGVRESAPNRGNAVDTYLVSVGLDPSAGSFPWCAAFAYYCCHQVGLWIPRTAGVWTLWSRADGLVVGEPKVGDVCVRLNGDGTGHCGIFMSRSENITTTVDGNTGVHGSREGDRVAIKERPTSYWTGYIRPARLEPDLT